MIQNILTLSNPILVNNAKTPKDNLILKQQYQYLIKTQDPKVEEMIVIEM